MKDIVTLLRISSTALILPKILLANCAICIDLHMGKIHFSKYIFTYRLINILGNLHFHYLEYSHMVVGQLSLLCSGSLTFVILWFRWIPWNRLCWMHWFWIEWTLWNYSLRMEWTCTTSSLFLDWKSFIILWVSRNIKMPSNSFASSSPSEICWFDKNLWALTVHRCWMAVNEAIATTNALLFPCIYTFPFNKLAEAFTNCCSLLCEYSDVFELHVQNTYRSNGDSKKLIPDSTSH